MQVKLFHVTEQMGGTVCYSLLLTSQALVTHPMHTQVFCSLLSLSLSLS